MKLEVFERIIGLIQAQQEKSHALYKIGIDSLNYEEDFQETISLLLKAYYGQDGADWIDWYVYEREGLSGNHTNSATDADGNPICYDVPSLWKCVEECRVSVEFEEYSLPKRKKPLSQTDFNQMFGKFLTRGGIL